MSIVDDSRWKNDVNALKGYEDASTTTTSAMGKIASDASGGKAAPPIHSNDKTYDELIAEYKGAGGSKAEIADASVHAGEVGLEVAGVLEGGTIATAVAVVGPVAAFALGMYKLAEANQRGAELNTALHRDEQHAAMLTNLALPNEFVQGELAKYSHGGKTFASGAQTMTSHARGEDHALMALVQLHCDQGMNAAHDGGPMSAEASKKYAEDPAFKAGYDAMKWAQHKGGDTLASLNAELASRDARYSAAGVSWRV